MSIRKNRRAEFSLQLPSRCENVCKFRDAKILMKNAFFVVELSPLCYSSLGYVVIRHIRGIKKGQIFGPYCIILMRKYE